MNQFIYHACSKKVWEQAKVDGAYSHPSIEEEGFIHCSTLEQVPFILKKFYADCEDVVVLKIEASKLSSKLLYEAASNGENYPHIYGNLNIDAVVDILDKESCS